LPGGFGIVAAGSVIFANVFWVFEKRTNPFVELGRFLCESAILELNRERAEPFKPLSSAGLKILRASCEKRSNVFACVLRPRERLII
jgi:hypothetical protein